jgi:2-aminoethylphosphonate-pyruvate transaminase
MAKTHQFRFTPPTHALIAFRQALIELEEEGGPAKRYERYCNNARVAREGFLALGFRELVPPDEQSKIINTFYYPTDKNFSFEKFYELLSEKGTYKIN